MQDDQGAAEALPERFRVAGVLASATTYAETTARVIEAARARRSLLVAATSVHGATLSALDAEFGRQLNAFDIVTPDGQPVRWALNLLHGAGLRDRVYGPWLMLRVCEAAAQAGLGVYLYGTSPAALGRLVQRLPLLVPGLRIAGYRSPPFRPTTAEEDAEDVRAILASGADILFLGISCPRQERWAYEHRARLPLPILCVGAAFDLHAGTVTMAPRWMQDRGLEWLYRVTHEPRRLWRRYATYPPLYVLLVTQQYLRQRVRGAV
jgi:exopolysaccharide biosynthesis WecB/TagA/CpsF family protein